MSARLTGFRCSECGATDTSNVIVNENPDKTYCQAHLAQAIVRGDIKITTGDGGPDAPEQCDNCGDSLMGDRAYCRNCVECETCSEIANTCYDHAACCEVCGDSPVDLVLCEIHHTDHDGESRSEADNACDECGSDEELVYCEEHARELWLGQTAPLAVLGENGQITVDGMEVNWN